MTAGIRLYIWRLKMGTKQVVQMLLDHKADVNATDGYYFRTTALHLAAENGHEAVVHVLLNHKADANVTGGCSGKTALHRAAENGHEAVVQHMPSSNL
jgi:ankyrin repeat protein